MSTAIVTAAISGFFLGASLIIAIGAQNAFILRQGLLRQHVFVLSLICALSDALLIAAGVAGLGTLISSSPRLIRLVTIGGAIFLLAYAVLALRRAFKPQVLTAAAAGEGSLKAGDRRLPRLHLPQPACLSRHGAADRLAVGGLSGRGPHRLRRGRGTCIVRVVFRAGLRRPAASAGLCQTGGVARARPHDRRRDDRDRDRVLSRPPCWRLTRSCASCVWSSAATSAAGPMARYWSTSCTYCARSRSDCFLICCTMFPEWRC